MDDKTIEKFWYHLTNSYNSDGQWPPTLPNAPHIIYPFNYEYCFENLMAAELLIGGVDRSKLTSSPIETMKEILTIQQDLILDKAALLMKEGTEEERCLKTIRANDVLMLLKGDFSQKYNQLPSKR